MVASLLPPLSRNLCNPTIWTMHAASYNSSVNKTHNLYLSNQTWLGQTPGLAASATAHNTGRRNGIWHMHTSFLDPQWHQLLSAHQEGITEPNVVIEETHVHTCDQRQQYMEFIHQQEQKGLVRTQEFTLPPQTLTYLPKGFFSGNLRGGLSSYPKNITPVRFLYIQPTSMTDNRVHLL